MDRDCIVKSRKRPEESDSAGNKRARWIEEREMTDRRRNETEEEKKLRLVNRRERDRARRAASSEKKAAELETPENRVARLDQMKTQKPQRLESETWEERATRLEQIQKSSNNFSSLSHKQRISYHIVFFIITK